MFKKIALGLIVLIVVLGVGANYLWSNLDSIIKATVEKYGSEATKTAVHLEGVKLSLTSGEGSLSGFSVGSPSGFSATKTLYLGAISVKIDTQSIAGNGPIVIQKIAIEKPQITYEINKTGDNNLQTIARNAQNYANGFTSSKSSSDNASTQTPPPATTQTSSNSGRKIIINDLTITDGQIAITHPLLQGKQLEAALPVIHLTNIGKSEGGTSPAEVAKLLLETITKNASQAVTANLTKALGSLKGLGTSALKAAIGGNAGSVINNAGGQIKSLFGQ